jgi:hypothetical protein
MRQFLRYNILNKFLDENFFPVNTVPDNIIILDRNSFTDRKNHVYYKQMMYFLNHEHIPVL